MLGDDDDGGVGVRESALLEEGKAKIVGGWTWFVGVGLGVLGGVLPEGRGLGK